jgi:hypothetical protein
MSPRGAKSDPFTAHQNGVTAAPTVVVVGGSDRSGRGEYLELVRACGWEPLRFGGGESAVHLDLRNPGVIFGARSGKANS